MGTSCGLVVFAQFIVAHAHVFPGHSTLLSPAPSTYSLTHRQQCPSLPPLCHHPLAGSTTGFPVPPPCRSGQLHREHVWNTSAGAMPNQTEPWFVPISNCNSRGWAWILGKREIKDQKWEEKHSGRKRSIEYPNGENRWVRTIWFIGLLPSSVAENPVLSPKLN